MNCERHEIFAEWLATPIRPARVAWFSAWRLVADGTASEDSEAVVEGVMAAAIAYAEMEGIFSQWFRRAREWKKRAVAVYSGFNGLRGFDAVVGSAAKTSDSASCPNQAAQNPTHAPDFDAMAEFVACLTTEQRVKLAALLLGDQGGTACPPGDAE